MVRLQLDNEFAIQAVSSEFAAKGQNLEAVSSASVSNASAQGGATYPPLQRSKGPQLRMVPHPELPCQLPKHALSVASAADREVAVPLQAALPPG